MGGAPKPSNASLWFGLWLIAIACFFLFFAGQIERLELSDENDPGPRAFPTVLSLTLLVGGLAQTLLAWRQAEAPREKERDETSLAGSRDALMLAAALLVYIALVPRIGFYAPTFVLATLMTWRLGARWWSAGITALVLIAVVRALFVGVFRVQLPEGLLSALV